MKTHAPTPGMWMAYITEVKEELGRNLTPDELKLALQAYMSKTAVAKFIEELPE